MGDLNDDNDPLSIWDHLYNFAGKTIKIHEDYDAGLGGTMFDGAALACNYFEYLHSENADHFVEKRHFIGTQDILKLDISVFLIEIYLFLS